jgi:hypothetical protein
MIADVFTIAKQIYTKMLDIKYEIKFLINLNNDNLSEIFTNQFADARFVQFTEELQLAQVLRQTIEPGSMLYCFGDFGVVNILTKTKPAFHIETYTTSPIFEQRKVIEFLKKYSSPIVWHKNSAITMDGLPLTVRDPLLLKEIIYGWHPVQKVGNFTILQPGEGQTKPDIDFWIEALTNEVNLKHIPRLSRLKDFPTLSNAEPNAILSLKLTVSEKFLNNNDMVSIKVTNPHNSFYIKFNIKHGCSVYEIFLDRLWFIDMKQQKEINNLSFTVPDGIYYELLWKQKISDILY